MGEKVLVFKGRYVGYSSNFQDITCIGLDGECFTIRDVPPESVKQGRGARRKTLRRGVYAIVGSKLWSDGEKYIISSRPR
jgi:hypothetical protein